MIVTTAERFIPSVFGGVWPGQLPHRQPTVSARLLTMVSSGASAGTWSTRANDERSLSAAARPVLMFADNSE